MANKAMIGLGLDENVSQGMQKISDSIEGVSGKSKQLEMIGKRIDDLSKKSLPAKRELKQLQDIMANMNLKGLSNTVEFTRAATRAGELKDAMADAAQAVKAYSDDVMTLQAGAQVFQGIAAAGSIATSSMALFGTENEKVAQILLKVQAAQGLLNGVTTIANMLNKDSVVMLKLKQIQLAITNTTTAAGTALTTANTVATTANTVATKVSTVAQTAWNAAKAIAKALLGDFTGLVLVGIGAVATYAAATAKSTDKTEENTKALKQQSKEIENIKDAESSYAKTTASNFANLMGTYDSLRNSWNKLKSAKEKNQFLVDNKTKIEQLTTAVHNIDSAEKFFKGNTADVVKSFAIRAKAAAAASLAVEQYKKAMEAEMNMTNNLRGITVTKSMHDLIPTPYRSYLESTKKDDKDNTIEWKIKDDTPTSVLEHFRKLGFYSSEQKKLRDQALDMAAQYTKLADIQEEANKHSGKSGGSSGSSTKEEKTLSQIIEDYKRLAAEIVKVQDYAKDGIITKEAGEKETNRINKLIDDLKKKYGLLELPVEPTLPENSIKALDDKIKTLQDKRAKLEIDSSEFEELTKQIKDLEHRKIEINAQINPTDAIKDVQNIVDDALNKEENVSDKYNFDFLPDDVAKKADDVVAQIQKVQDAQKELQEIIDNTDGSHSTTEIEAAKDALEDLGFTFDYLTQQAEKFNQANEKMKNVERSVETAEQAANAFGSLGDAFSQAGDESTGAAFKIMSSAAQLVAQLIPLILKVIGAKEAESMANASSSASELPFPANIAAIASSIAAVAGTFASILSTVGAFADGGVIKGSSTMGDHLLARVNAGEMILNGKQQANLFKALDEGQIANKSNVNVTVTGKVRGKDLELVLANLNGVKKLTSGGLKF